KHVLCEKPLASNADEVREIIAAGLAQANPVKVMEAFMYRFHPQTERMRQLLASGAIGEIKVIRASFGFRLQIANDIRWSAELAGGSLMDMGCYCVNATRMAAGGNPVTVTAHQTLAPSGVDEATVGTMEFANGILATIDCSFRTGDVLQQAFSASGTEGRILLAQLFRSDEGALALALDSATDMDRG